MTKENVKKWFDFYFNDTFMANYIRLSDSRLHVVGLGKAFLETILDIPYESIVSLRIDATFFNDSHIIVLRVTTTDNVVVTVNYDASIVEGVTL